MSVTEFKRTYFGTVLGYLWSLIAAADAVRRSCSSSSPRSSNRQRTCRHYPVLLLLGIVLFTFFQEATTNAVTSVVAQEGVVRKTQFPRLVIPLSTVLTGAFNLGLNLVVVLVFILAYGVDPIWTWLLFPFALAAALRLHGRGQHDALGRSTSASATSRSSGRSSRQALFYATPILYPIDSLRQRDLRTPADDQPAGGRSSSRSGSGSSTRARRPRSRRPAAWLSLLPAARSSSASASSRSGSSTARRRGSPRICAPAMARTLVVGCGFIGSHLVTELAARGTPPAVLTRWRPRPPEVLASIEEGGLHLGDASDPEVVATALEGSIVSLPRRRAAARGVRARSRARP